MPHLPYERYIVTSAARTATGNSGALDWPTDAETALIILDCTAVSGTSPTLDVAIQVSPDDGATFYTIQRFAQVTAAAKRRILFAPKLHSGEAAAEGAIADTGGALAANHPMSRKYRIFWTIGGTSPSFTFAVALIATLRGGYSY